MSNRLLTMMRSVLFFFALSLIPLTTYALSTPGAPPGYPGSGPGAPPGYPCQCAPLSTNVLDFCQKAGDYCQAAFDDWNEPKLTKTNLTHCAYYSKKCNQALGQEGCGTAPGGAIDAGFPDPLPNVRD